MDMPFRPGDTVVIAYRPPPGFSWREEYCGLVVTVHDCFTNCYGNSMVEFQYGARDYPVLPYWCFTRLPPPPTRSRRRRIVASIVRRNPP